MAKAPQYHILPNGFQVVVHPDDRFPLVSLRLYVRAGSAHEDPGKEGISHFLEHMVFKGSETRLPGQVAREIEEVGGYLNAATSFDYTVYTIDLPSQEWSLGLDVLQDMIFGSIFDPHELNREIKVVLAEIERSLDNPGSRVFRAVQTMLLNDTPYQHPILGFKETVEGFDRHDLKEYISRKYRPGSMVLAVSGDIDPEHFLAEADRLFGGLLNQNAVVLPEPLDIRQSLVRDPQSRISVEQGPWSKSYVAMAVPAPAMSSSEIAAFDVLAYLLGGDRTSLLYREFKYDQGLVDQISSQVLSLERAGMMYFYVQMDPDGLENLWEKFLQRLSSLTESDFTREQINRAVTNIEEGLFRSRETLGGTASSLAFNQLFTGDPQAEDRYLHSLRRVTRDDLQRIIDNYLSPDNMVAAAVVPEHAYLTGEVMVQALDQHTSPGPAAEEKAAAARKETQVIELGQGRTLVLIHDHHLPHAAVSIAWPGGNNLISPDQQGLPELAARALTRETRYRSFEQIQEFLRDRASSINASAGRNSFNLSARFPAKYSSDILELVSEVILSPSFSEQELQRAVSEQVAEIRRQEDRPVGYAFRHLFPFLFSAGPYSYLQLGKEDFLLGATPQMAASYWERQKSTPFVISVCGSIDEEAVDNLVSALNEIKPDQEKTVKNFTWSEKRAKDIVLRDRAQAHVLMVFPVPGKDHPHTPGLEVLNKVLAGQGGLLFRELRDRQGLAYSVTSMLWQSPDTGFLALYIGTYEDSVDEAVKGFEGVVDQMRSQAIPEEAVQRAYNLIFGEYHRGRQTISSRAGEASSLLVQGLDLGFNLEMTEMARKVSPEDLQDLAVKYLDPDESYLMRILPN